MSLVFLEALVDPSGLPRGRFAGGTLLLRLDILLFPTSIHGSSVELGRSVLELS